VCGIIGYCGPKPAANVLVEGLKRLEYRGYDSAGISVLRDGQITVYKKKGKINDLKGILPDDVNGETGIGHTRWATHGEVNDLNAHPHTNKSGTIAVVHNGIIENFVSLRGRLEEDGYEFSHGD
jgi:glucosamine--fructose-6-phosphate aminotransferase (isomerizing)